MAGFKCSSCALTIETVFQPRADVSSFYMPHKGLIGFYLPHRDDPNFGNCAACGNFSNVTAVRMAQKVGYRGAGGFRAQAKPSQAIRDPDQHYRAEVPMDVILEKIVKD